MKNHNSYGAASVLRKITLNARLELWCAIVLLVLTLAANLLLQGKNLRFLSYTLLLNCLLFMEGTYYWRIKRYVLGGGWVRQESELAFFARAQKLNIILFALSPVVLLSKWFISGNPLIVEHTLFIGIVAILLALLGHINLFHQQIFYSSYSDWLLLLRKRQLKRSSLRKDLQELHF